MVISMDLPSGSNWLHSYAAIENRPFGSLIYLLKMVICSIAMLVYQMVWVNHIVMVNSKEHNITCLNL